MQSDVVLHRGNSVIQHGHFNNRVYVMKLAPEEIPDILRFADDITNKEGYTKIFVKVPESSVEIFTRNGYVTEATVPLFYQGNEPAVFMAKYVDPKRKLVRDAPMTADILAAALDRAIERSPQVLLPDGFSLIPAHAGDVNEIAALYRSVFKTYPFPIFDPDYIKETMQGHIRYFIIRNAIQLAAVASCEIDSENKNIEVTDFATDPQFRGKGFARALLHAMETDLKKEGILLAYTIARAISHPINLTFSGAGYLFGGLLPNNTNICGSMESMNVWYKKL